MNAANEYSLEEGTDATIIISPDNGYRIKSVKVNNADVTSGVSNSSYTISSISANTIVEVEFEAIPIPMYSLSITASGSGSVSYSETSAKNNTQSFTLNEGTSATITITPDNGYRIKSVKVNSADVTSNVSNGQYIVSSIKANTTVEVVFEAIPIPTYTLSITAFGNGSASYSGTSAKNSTKTFTLNEGTLAAIIFTPDTGYRIKSVKVNSTDVTSKVSNNSYTISSISANTTVEVVFEAIPIPTYTLSITASGNGSVSYSGTSAKNNTKTFTVNEGTSAAIAFTPDAGYRIKSVKVNSTDVTSKVSNSSYTISSINANTTVDVVFEAIPVSSYTLKYIVDGETYKTYQIQEGATITPEAMPTKEGYTFSGWSEIPQIMPSMDVTVVGTFTKNEPTIKTYTLTIHASGNGSAVYGLTTAKNNSQTITVNQGTSPTITFFPDNGYRIKSVKVNSADVTSWVLNNSYTISSISADTTVEVEFEAIPVSSYTLKYVVDGETYKTYQVQEGAAIIPEVDPEKDGYTFSGWSDIPKVMPANDVTVTGTFIKNAPVIKYYTLSLKATGSGSVSYNAIVVENNTQAISIEEGVQAVVKFTPHDGYLIKSATMNGRQIADLSSMSFTIDIMDEDVTIEVEFEAIPVSSYTLKYVIDGETYKTFQIEEGTTISPEAEPTKEGYTFSGWSAIPATMPANDVIITGTFTKNPDETTISGKCGENVYYSYDKTTHMLTIYGKGPMLYLPDPDLYPWWSFYDEIQQIVIENGVTSIEWGAFEGCSSLISIMLPESLNFVHDYAFMGCKNLTAVYISDLEAYLKVRFIDREAPSNPLYYAHHLFLNGKEIVDLVIPDGITNIYNYAFVNGSSIKTVYIPKSVTSIGEEAFAGCNSLTSITIPSSVTNIGNGAFNGTAWYNNQPEGLVYAGKVAYNYKGTMPSNTNISLKEGTMGIAGHAFYYCGDLSSISIPNSVTCIGEGAFWGCSGLTSITIPNSVTSIDNSAFFYCSGLISVVSEIDKPFKIDNSVFNGIPSDAQLIVPKGTKAKYQSTPGWNKFTNIVEAGEEPDPSGQIHINDIIYKVTGSGEVEVVSAENGVTSITIPSSVSYNNTVYKVTSIAKDAFETCEHLSAVIWEPEAQFNAKVNNPNFLLYVSDDKYASRSVKNVVLNGVAESIELTDAASGNDFYCPKAFIARNISYSHHYSMETGLGDAKGWETIVLPFDVKKYTSQKGEIIPFAKWTSTGTAKPFWLCELTTNGYREVEGIKANTPYIISMPNNRQYQADYVITGIVTFSAENVEVKASADMQSATYQDRTLVPNYTNKNDENSFALNVKNYYVNNSSTDKDGSKFIKGLRSVHPFEAYMTTTSNTRSIDVFDGMTTAIREIVVETEGTELVKVYDTRGILVKTVMNTEDMRKGLAPGVYIVNGKKMIIK